MHSVLIGWKTENYDVETYIVERTMREKYHKGPVYDDIPDLWFLQLWTLKTEPYDFLQTCRGWYEICKKSNNRHHGRVLKWLTPEGTVHVTDFLLRINFEDASDAIRCKMELGRDSDMYDVPNGALTFCPFIP